ncbi:MAG: hypothetical protein ACLQQ4_09510 [Bacteroidia bacterium]
MKEHAELFIALGLAGLGTLFQDLANHTATINYALHMALQASKGFMYIGSGVAGIMGAFKMYKENRKNQRRTKN